MRKLHSQLRIIYLIIPKVLGGGIQFYLRPFTCYLVEYMEEAIIYTEDWLNDYAYIKADKLSPILEQEQILTAN